VLHDIRFPVTQRVQLSYTAASTLHRFSSRLARRAEPTVNKPTTSASFHGPEALPSISMHLPSKLSSAIIFAVLTMATSNPTCTPVTRVATFRFRENVTAEQKGDRARAFLGLYEAHQELLVGMPKGGKPLNTPLNLTNVKRDSVWDMGFTVTFKVGIRIFRGNGSGEYADRVLQSEEARLEFDKEPGHDKLKVSVFDWICSR